MSRRHHISYTVRSRQSVGFGAILLHTILTCITGGFWLIVLAIRYMLR